MRVLFIVLLGGYYLRVSGPVADHVEYAGLIPKLEQLARTIGDDDLVIAESRDTNSDVHVLALPLAYVYGRNVLVLFPLDRTRRRLPRFSNGRRRAIAGCSSSAAAEPICCRIGTAFDPFASERFQVPEYDAPLNAFPRFVRQKEFEYGDEFTAAEPVPTRAASTWISASATTSTSSDFMPRRYPKDTRSDGRARPRTCR